MSFHIADDDQGDLPLVKALEDYCRKQPVRLHVPGHGGNFPPWLPDSLADFDATELENLDDLHNPGGVIAAAQAKAAGLFGARHTFFLVNGASVGIQALIAATCDEHHPLVLPRNAHRSVLGGLMISGARPIFLTPEVVPGFAFAASFRSAELAEVLRQNPAVGAVLAVHPNYYGVTGDLAGAAAICRQHSVPLLVDEAHGTHLRFHPALPADALSLGAVGVVQSVHKTGGALTQAAWLHLGFAHDGVAAWRENVAEMLRLLQTTSPSYLLLASLDAARGYLASQGREILDRLLTWIDAAVQKINRLPGLAVLGPGHLGTLVNAGHDPTRLVVSVRGLGLTGHEAADWLAGKHGIYLEMSDPFNIVAVLSLGTPKSALTALVNGLAELSRQTVAGGGEPGAGFLPLGTSLPPQVLTPRQAWQAPRRTVPLARAVGLISAEAVSLHPPGIAVIYPGEEITPAVVEYLLQGRAWGWHYQGAADPELRTIRIVAR